MNQLIVRNTHQKKTSMLFLSCCIVLGIHVGPKYWMLPAHVSQLSSGFGNCSCVQHEASFVNQDGWWEATILGWYEIFNKTRPFPCQPTATPPNPRVPLPAHQGTPLLSPNPLACLPRPSRKNGKWHDNLWFLSRFPSDSLCSYVMVNTFSFTNVSLFLHIWSQIMHTWVNPPDWTLYLCIFHPIRTKKNGNNIYQPLNTSTLKITPSLVHHLEHVPSLSTQPLPNKQVPLLTLDHISHFQRENRGAGTIAHHFITQGS